MNVFRHSLKTVKGLQLSPFLVPNFIPRFKLPGEFVPNKLLSNN